MLISIAEKMQMQEKVDPGIKEEGHSKKRIFLVNANKNIVLSAATHRSFIL